MQLIHVGTTYATFEAKKEGIKEHESVTKKKALQRQCIRYVPN